MTIKEAKEKYSGEYTDIEFDDKSFFIRLSLNFL